MPRFDAIPINAIPALMRAEYTQYSWPITTNVSRLGHTLDALPTLYDNMKTLIRHHFQDLLFDPSNLFRFACLYTVALTALAAMIGWFFPSFALAAFCLAIYVILEAWRYYYSDWVENSLYPSPKREAIGNLAFFVHLRIATSGALASIFVLMMARLLLGYDPMENSALLTYGACVAAIPMSFFSLTVKRFLIAVLRELWGIPFNLAFVLIGLNSDEDDLDERYKRVHSVAKKVFWGLTGYRSNLTLLHETDDILERLPTIR